MIAPADGQHGCMADGCDTRIPTEQAFCRSHYKLLTHGLRNRLVVAYRHWARGGETMQDGAERVRKLREVQAECREAIARREGRAGDVRNSGNGA